MLRLARKCRPALPLRAFFCVLLVAVTAGCSASQEAARQLAQRQGFREHIFSAGRFDLYGQLKAGTGPVLHVYIEGDGYAWKNRHSPSANPTPRHAVALQLAVHDPSTAPVLYLARPCQYVQGEHWRNCHVRYWTAARLNRKVIESLHAAIDAAKRESKASHVVLVGYSGGGGAAVLLAAMRHDVVFLGTVAGNIHSAAWTAALNISPLHQSLEPFAVAQRVAHIPQRHYSSRADQTMPPLVSASFCRATGQPQQCVVLDTLEHGGNWAAVWDYTYTGADVRNRP